ncbi:uncharacterized protein LOC132298886 isoform X2 [Cornus florida]|uniref:uncharacterized protein LOC132298886 isoform X2 n=1 Tax=Cornus florida TaxID=4283 RepID=UPI0028970E52|nr:uncharacterized protein LOC132298886 isoform X2 [Cornus florida]
MDSLCEEEDHFYDTREGITSASDSDSDGVDNLDTDSSVVDLVPSGIGYEVWNKNPESIRERRHKFLKWMGFSSEETVREVDEDANCDQLEVEIERAKQNSGAVLRTLGFDDGHSSSQSSISYRSNDTGELLDGALDENFSCRFKNLDDGTEFIVDKLGLDGFLTRLREVGSNRLITFEEFERTLGLSPLIQPVMRRQVEEVSGQREVMKQVKRGWLRRLGVVACVVDRQVEAGNSRPHDSYPISGVGTKKIRVRTVRKRCKEFSALYMGQDISAHKGSILTMKFSPDGQYLASAGEDGIVRVWQVMESERSHEFDLSDVDPSFVYFTVNHLSELVPLYVDKERRVKPKNLSKSSDAACVVFPQKLFRISEKPLHEFHGHCGEVLDLSWSKNKCLLSSSIDKTVRLWQVGSDECLKVFIHTDYVTCIQFNPVDDNYFISGSIDGKVRIWAVPSCQVVDWTDVTEIVTAVCYRLDGKGGIVGSLTGNCRFYDASDNRLQLYAQICLQSKKKSPFKRITGFQVRILHGVDVICKYRGLRNAGSQISASFTSDGQHIVSASEDSNIFMWNYISQNGRVCSKMKSNLSCERFFSNNASVAIPWCGMTCGNSIFSNISVASSSPKISVNQPKYGSEYGSQQCHLGDSPLNKLPFFSHDFSLSHGFFSDSLPKVSATWPEEKLQASSSLVVPSAMCKSQYKLLKSSCQNVFGSPHMWGLVIVTAGWDGRIRTFQNYGLPVRS